MNLERKKFIEAIAAAAQTECAGTGLFASLMIAQACLESANGKSTLAAKHHNYFGIKSSAGWKGATVSYLTTEFVKGKSVRIKQPFRSYPDRKAGFADRVHFLQVNPRYRKNGVFDSETPEQQAECFLKAGYATDPAYPDKLKAIISTYELKQYDNV